MSWTVDCGQVSLDDAHSSSGGGNNGHGLNEMCPYHSWCIFVRVGGSPVTTGRLVGWIPFRSLAPDPRRLQGQGPGRPFLKHPRVQRSFGNSFVV